MEKLPPDPYRILPLMGKKASDCKSQSSQVPMATIGNINQPYQLILCSPLYQVDILHFYDIGMFQFCHAHSSMI